MAHPAGHDHVPRRLRRRPERQRGRARWATAGSACSTGSTGGTTRVPAARSTPRRWPPARSSPGAARSSTRASWQGDHHDGVPIFILTHEVPADPPPGSVRYVTDAREAAAQARAAAGDADVVVQGAGAAQALLRAGELDEMELHVVPVLLGQGRRLFDDLPRPSTSIWSGG